MNVFRVTRYGLLVSATAVALTACADNPAAESADPAPTSESTGNPSLEPTGPEATRPPGEGGVSVTLPGLPIGGRADPEEAKHQCVPVNWLEPKNKPKLPDGVSVSVTGVQLEDEGLFEMDKGGCGGAPRCDTSFVFTAHRMKCSVPVTATGNGGDTTYLSVTGKANCAVGQAQKCEDLADRVSPGSIPVTQPDGPSDPDEQQPPTTTEQSPPTSTS